MKKSINIKNVIVSLVFLIIGIGMLLFVLFVVLPAMTHNAEVCTLEVEAVVIENEPYWTTTGDGESVRRYRQIGEYTVDNKKITLTITDQKTDPVPEGTKITLWVNPKCYFCTFWHWICLLVCYCQCNFFIINSIFTNLSIPAYRLSIPSSCPIRLILYNNRLNF